MNDLLLLAALQMIDRKLCRLMSCSSDAAGQSFGEYPSPFANTGNRFSCDAFSVKAFDWDDDSDDVPNFKWGTLEVRWYKYLGRGMEVSREMSADEIGEMLVECVEALELLQLRNEEDDES